MTTQQQVAFGIDFERDPYVQSLAGKEGLTSLLSNVFDGIELVQVTPLLQVLIITVLLRYKALHNGVSSTFLLVCAILRAKICI